MVEHHPRHRTEERLESHGRPSADLLLMSRKCRSREQLGSYAVEKIYIECFVCKVEITIHGKHLDLRSPKASLSSASSWQTSQQNTSKIIQISASSTDWHAPLPQPITGGKSLYMKSGSSNSSCSPGQPATCNYAIFLCHFPLPRLPLLSRVVIPVAAGLETSHVLGLSISAGPPKDQCLRALGMGFTWVVRNPVESPALYQVKTRDTVYSSCIWMFFGFSFA